MNGRTWSVTAAVFLAAAMPDVHAARFESSYLSFELPQGWSCDQEGTEFVCLPPRSAAEATRAALILTAKVPGADDTLAAYRERLEQVPPATGKGYIVTPARIVRINGTLWVDATLRDSELPNYLTRYVATSSDRVAVLFTFSAHYTRYDSLIGPALQAIYTLEVKLR